jgi:hypothetical protein
LLIGFKPVDKAAITRDMAAWGQCERLVEQIKTDLAHKRRYKARKEGFMFVEGL